MTLSISVRKPPYVMFSSDYSQQEPSLLSAISQDDRMIESFKTGRDIYSTIAALAFNLPYEDCLEFVLDENGNKTDITNPEGKKRRTEAKSIVLGRFWSCS